MIYIEVIFGSINGNAIDVDAAMSDTSTNPVQNKVIKAALDALQRNIDAVAGSITKDVVEVETYDDLAEIEEPRTDVIYVTTDTNKLYLNTSQSTSGATVLQLKDKFENADDAPHGYIFVVCSIACASCRWRSRFNCHRNGFGER